MQALIDLSQWLDQVSGSLQPEASELEQAAEHQKQRILDRTAQGVGVDLQPFAGYVDTHQPEKFAATGKQFRHEGHLVDEGKWGIVDLRKTGAMLDSISVEATDEQARIFFADPHQEEIAGYINEGTRKMQERHFFGASLSDHEEIVSDVREALFRRLNNG